MSARTWCWLAFLLAITPAGCGAGHRYSGTWRYFEDPHDEIGGGLETYLCLDRGLDGHWVEKAHFTLSLRPEPAPSAPEHLFGAAYAVSSPNGAVVLYTESLHQLKDSIELRGTLSETTCARDGRELHCRDEGGHEETWRRAGPYRACAGVTGK